MVRGLLVRGANLEDSRIKGSGGGGTVHVGDVEAVRVRGGPLVDVAQGHDDPSQATVDVVLVGGDPPVHLLHGRGPAPGDVDAKPGLVRAGVRPAVEAHAEVEASVEEGAHPTFC